MTLGIAFKEWAVICTALGSGQQSLILRKGGIADRDGLFTPEYDRFWLYPTYLHQQRDGIRPEAISLLEAVERDRPPADELRLNLFVEVAEIFRFDDLSAVRRLDPLHVWSGETVEKRFHYRTPGLFVLAVRTFQVPESHVVPVRPEYDGCKTWVELRDASNTDGATPVLDQATFAETLDRIRDVASGEANEPREAVQQRPDRNGEMSNRPEQ